MWKALDGSTKITVLCSHKNTEYHCVTGWTNQFCLKCGNIKRYATTDSGVQKFPKFEMVLRAYVLIINSCCCQALFIVVIKQKCNLLISVSHKPLSMVCMCIFRTILGKNRYQKIGASEKLGTYHADMIIWLATKTNTQTRCAFILCVYSKSSGKFSENETWLR